jgi:hypothetical protein
VSRLLVTETHADGYEVAYWLDYPDQTPSEAYEALRARYKAHQVIHAADPQTLTLTVPMTECDGVARTKTMQFVAVTS